MVKDTHVVPIGFGEDKDTHVKDTHRAGFRPVTVLPAAPPAPAATPTGGRRPTVAVLDTGLAAHPWFDAEVTREATERAAEAEGHGGDHRRHGTFVAGVVRQTAPDAHILSIELAQTAGGKVRDGEIVSALTMLLDRAVTPATFVDVVCLAVGYRPGPGEGDDPHRTAEIADAVRRLGERGVLLVAAAGNRTDESGDGCVQPAALATADEFPVVAVGATDGEGGWAAFSVRDCATRRFAGTDVVSAFPFETGPVDAFPRTGSGIIQIEPESDVDLIETRAEGHLPIGYAKGSGTSFAAAGFAGAVAQALWDAGPEALADLGGAAARARARTAVDAAGGRVPPQAG